jgi:N-formylmaleamate deformylase
VTHSWDASGESGYADLPAGRFHYRRWAAGPEAPGVVLVHGNGSSWTTWCRVAPALRAAGLDVYAVDLRGNGASVRPPVGSYGLPQIAGDLHDLVEALPLRAPTLVGHCWGAAAAVGVATGAFGERKPPPLGGLVLEELPSDMASTADQAVVDDYLRMMRSPQEYVRRRVDLICRNWHPDDRESLVENACGADEDVYLSAIKDGAAAGPLHPLLARIAVPTLALRGNPWHGSMLSDEDWRVLRRHLPPGAAAHDFPGAGHEIHRADCTGFIRALLEFLRA